MTQVFVFIIEKINRITYYKLVMYNFWLVHNKSFTHTNSKSLHLDMKCFCCCLKLLIHQRFFWMSVWQGLTLQKKGNSSKDPFAGLLLTLQVESPDECWTSGLCLVDWTLIDVPSVLPVDWDGPDKDDRHCRRQLLQSCFIDHARLHVPSGSLHKQAVDVSTFSGRACHVLTSFLCDVTLQTHAIQWPLVFTSHLLHDGCEEGLWVEESSEPDSSRKLEVRWPGLQLLHSQQKISIPCSQTIQGWISLLVPALWDKVHEESIS